MTQTSRGGKRAAVGRGIYRGKGANRGEIWGEERAPRRGAQLEPRGKLRDLGGSGWGPGCGPSCWNTVEVKCLRNMKRSSTGEQTLCRILRRNISSGSRPCPFTTQLLHRVLKWEHTVHFTLAREVETAVVMRPWEPLIRCASWFSLSWACLRI